MSKKISIGDVVVIRANDPKIHPSYNGCLGLVIGRCSQGHEVQVTDDSTEYYYFRSKSLIVIDCILDEMDQRPRKGDVVVCSSHNPLLFGLLGEVVATNIEPTASTSTAFVRFNEFLLGGRYQHSEIPEKDLEVIDHIDDDISSFKVGDRVEYTGKECANLARGTVGIISIAYDGGNSRVRFSNGAEMSFLNEELRKMDEPAVAKPQDILIGDTVEYTDEGVEAQTEKGFIYVKKGAIGTVESLGELSAKVAINGAVVTILKEALRVVNRTIKSLDLPGGANSWLLAIDVSGSAVKEDTCRFLINHKPQLICKVAETLTFDTGRVHVYWGMPDTDSIDFGEGRGGTDIACVLDFARLKKIKNILIFSDGYFALPHPALLQGIRVLIVKTAYGKAEPLIESFGGTIPKVEHVEQVCDTEPLIESFGGTIPKVEHVEQVCDTDQFQWPYNAKPSMLKCEEHSAAQYIDGYFVDLITHAPEGIIEVVCHGCGHKIKEIKLDLAKEDPRFKNFSAFKS